MKTYNEFEFSENGKFGRAKSDVAIIGAPFDLGASWHNGQKFAPDAIREAGYWEESMGSVRNGGVDAMKELNIVDCGNVYVAPGDFNGGLEAIRAKVAQVHANTRFPIILGGDHSASAKAVQAMSQASGGPLTLFHYDAHGDFEKHDTVDFNHGTWVRWCLENGFLNRVVQFGVRGWGYDKTLLTWADKNDITIYGATDSGLMQKLQAELAATSDPIYLSIDVDVLDPAFAPGVSHPEPGGFTSREIMAHIATVVSDKKTIAMDVMEVIPARDQSELTVKVANRIVAQALTSLSMNKR